ncbi:MAG: BTAD domain-containing putative transcriptional regulator, partial [Dehalococcoidia bacterium]|nr:BTAD domain-containing putative transcriptional regulator [Dehalococcoidia bacterium]
QVLKAMMDVSEADQGIINLWGSDGAVVHSESNPRAVVPCIRQRNWHQCPAHLKERPVVNTGPGSAATAACRESLGEARTAVCFPIRALGQSIGVVSLRFLRPQPVPTQPLALLGAMARSAGRVLREAWPYLEEESHGLAHAEDSSKEMRKGWVQASERGPVSPGEVIEARKAQAPAQVTPPFLDIRCFGSFQIYSDGNPLPPASFGRRQSFTVLKILVTRRGRPVSADFLSETLWPDTEPEATKKRLWVIIHNLRMALEPGLKHGQPSHFVHRNGDAYTFDPGVPIRLDVDEFTQGLARGDCSEARGDLRDAAAAYEQTTRLYRGDFMEEELYSDWCSSEREYLREVYLALLGRLASLHATWKEWDRSIAWRRRALLVDGLREETHRELMRCLRSAGRRDEALRQYQECRLVLDRELSVEPLPETAKIYREILGEEKHSSAS